MPVRRCFPVLWLIVCWFFFLSRSDLCLPTHCRYRGNIVAPDLNQWHTHTVGHLCTSHRPDAETFTGQHNTHNRHPRPWRVSNPQSQQASSRSIRMRGHRSRLRQLTQPQTLKTCGSSCEFAHIDIDRGNFEILAPTALSPNSRFWVDLRALVRKHFCHEQNPDCLARSLEVFQICVVLFNLVIVKWTVQLVKR
jgi:hypothetical protein